MRNSGKNLLGLSYTSHSRYTAQAAMLSSGHQYQSGYGYLGSGGGNTMTQQPDHNGPSHQGRMTGLDALAQGSQYALQQLRDSHAGQQDAHRRETYAGAKEDSSNGQQQQYQHDQAGADVKSATGSVRRRISRACDQCNQLRTKCDGKTPCAHCVGMIF